MTWIWPREKSRNDVPGELRSKKKRGISVHDLPPYYQRQIANADNPPIPASNSKQSSSHELVSEEGFKGFSTPVSIRVHSKRKRPTDADGVFSKWAIDALIGKVLPNDDPKHVKEVFQSQEKSKVNETIIEIYEA